MTDPSRLSMFARVVACSVVLAPLTAAQEWNLAGDAVALRFEADASTGATLAALRNPSTGAEVHFDRTLAPGLWEVVLYDPAAPTTPRLLRASDARHAFRVETLERGLAFCWDRVSLAGTSDRFDVRVCVRTPCAGEPLDFASRWEIAVLPFQPRNTCARVFRVNFPLLAVDPLDQGLLTADLMAGTATPQSIFPATLILDQLGSQRYESVHPGKGDPLNFLQPLPAGISYRDFHLPGSSGRQTFQWDCLRFYPYPGTSSSAPLARELLWLGSDDARGWFKTYNLETVAEPAPVPHAAIRWSVGHMAPLDPDPRTNVSWPYVQPYACLVGLKPYTGPEWWFDVVEPYRDWVRRRSVVPLGSIERNPIFRSSSWDENSIYQGVVSYFLQLVPAPYPAGLGEAHLDASVRLAEDYHAAFPATPMNCQWQFTSERPIQPTTEASPPVFPTLGASIDRVHTNIPRSAVAYYNRFDLPVDEPPPAIRPERRFDYGVYALDGSLRFQGNLTYPMMNFGAFEARSYHFQKTLLPFATVIGASAVHMDVLGGTGPDLSYGNWTADRKYLPHIPGGGSYWQDGKRAYLAAALALVKLVHPTRPAYVSTEHTEETLAGWVDVTGQQVGRTPFVDHRLFVPPLPGPGTFDHEPDVPFLPPLWNAIYHEFQPSAALNMLHTVDWLATRGGPLPDAWFLELALYTHMTEFVTGNNPFTFLVTTDAETGQLGGFGRGLFDVDANGTLLPTDPNGTGLHLVQRLQDLKRARDEHVGGPWLLRGRMERPLSIVRFRTELHPLRHLAVAQAHPYGPFLSYVRNIYPPILYSFFPALTTYHTVWSAPANTENAGSRLLCVVNWSAQPSHYALRVDPASVLPESNGSFELFAVDLTTGARTPVGTEMTGSRILDFGGGYGGAESAVALPAVPAQSVVLYEIR